MEVTGKLVNVTKDWESGKFCVTFLINENIENFIDELKDALLTIKAFKFKKKRSLEANKLLWECLGQIAIAIKSNKWDVYLEMLRRYGKFTYICVKPDAVENVKKQWRETEEIGTVNINGKEAIQMLCYFGTSTYNTKEFSVLLDGVISEMIEIGLQPPTSKEMQRSLEKWQKLQS